ncbi:MAG: hypothetical protein AAFX06_05220 [Planctomycetota bacterium]
MRRLKSVRQRSGPQSALLEFLRRPFYALTNQLTTSVRPEPNTVSVPGMDQAMQKGLEQLGLAEWQIKQLAPLLDANVTRRFIDDLVTSRDQNALVQLVQAMYVLVTLKQSHFSLLWEYHDHDWVESFPKSLHRSLKLLSEATTDAPRIAKKLLAHDVPCREKLGRERDYLQRALDEGLADTERRDAFRQRISDIDDQCVSRPELSAERLVNLNRKIAKRAVLECGRTLSMGIRRAVSRALQPQRIDITHSTLPDALLLSLVQHIQGMDSDFQEHGWRLLKHVVDGTEPRWDDHAENVRYVSGLNTRGVCTAAWLDRDRRFIADMGLGEKVILQFTHSALDYLLMGHHFATCLSPDDENFFSTIANAVDVNKQVLYARTVDGDVVGRCLMAISTERKLLIFDVYAHRWYREICVAVKDFAEQLAAEMKIAIAVDGDVSSLVVDEWYDDGAIDIQKQIERNSRPTSVEVEPPPAPEIASGGRLGAIDLSGADSDFLVTLASNYHSAC